MPRRPSGLPADSGEAAPVLAPGQRGRPTAVAGAVHLAKRVLPAMIASGDGGVLFTSSIAATAPGPYYVTYAASKAFLLSFSEALRYELRDTGVR